MTSQIRSRANLYTFSEVLTLKAPDTAVLLGGGGQNKLHNWVLTTFACFDTADNCAFQWKIETGKRKIVSSPSKEEFRGLSAPDGERIASRGWRILQETKSRSKTWNCRLMRATKQVSRRDEGEIQPVTNLSNLLAQSLSNLSEGEDAVVLALASYKCGEGVYPVRGTRRAHLC